MVRNFSLIRFIYTRTVYISYLFIITSSLSTSQMTFGRPNSCILINKCFFPAKIAPPKSQVCHYCWLLWFRFSRTVIIISITLQWMGKSMLKFNYRLTGCYSTHPHTCNAMHFRVSQTNGGLVKMLNKRSFSLK